MRPVGMGWLDGNRVTVIERPGDATCGCGNDFCGTEEAVGFEGAKAA